MVTTAASRLGKIRASTLVVVGGQDWPDIEEIARLLETGIAGAKRAAIAGAAHLVNVERPHEYNRLVPGFLARRSRGRAGAPSEQR